MIKRAFTEHPASVGESYFQHMGMAFSFGAKMVGAGLACLLHGLLPFLFKRTGRRCIEDLHDRMVVNRDRRAKPGTCDEAGAQLPPMKSPERIMRAAE